MDDGNDPQLYVPAKSDQALSHTPISIYLHQPSRPSFPWVPVLLTVLLLVIFGFVARVYLLNWWFHEEQKTFHNVALSIPRQPVHYVAGSSPQFPPSQTLRLAGVMDMGHPRYVAQSSSGSGFVLIPSSDCRVESGAPVCHFQGKTVTRFTG